MRIHTIGHSTRSTEEFVALLDEHGVRRLVDVRRHPGSRRHPHFRAESLAASLDAAGIAYRHAPELGGRRSGRADSPNTAWRNAGFRAYADHMDAPAFRDALGDLIEEARREPTAIMCAEAVYWRCHRRLIADALVARGIDVVHSLGPGDARDHELHPAAQVRDDGRIIYPASPTESGSGQGDRSTEQRDLFD